MTELHLQTPMMQQYMEIKNSHKDSILLFRLGDFYEMFFEDAIEASKILDIALTSRNKSSSNAVPLCGIPYHSADSYIAKLVKSGRRVAICEQVENPQKARERGPKAIVRREVTQVITPGVNFDDKILDADTNNYLLSYSIVDSSQELIAITFIDISTEEFKITFKNSFYSALDEIISISPKEIVVSDSTRKTRFTEFIQKKLTGTFFSFLSDSLIQNFSDITKNPNYENFKMGSHSIDTILTYLKQAHSYNSSLILQLANYRTDEFMNIDPRTESSLELIHSNFNKDATLFCVLNFTKTSMAKRKLKNWIKYPLIKKDPIKKRLDAVEFLKQDKFYREDLQECLSRLNDLERLTGKAQNCSINPRDVLGIKTSLLDSININSIKQQNSPELISQNLIYNELENIRCVLQELSPLLEILENAISDNLPLNNKDGGFIKQGYSEELDQLRTIKYNAKGVIAQIEAREKEKTGITNLKVKFNNVFGYFIEISSSKLNLVPSDYIRKQTISNGERFITQELKELETKILTSQEKIEDLEINIFSYIREMILKHKDLILNLADSISTLDVLCSLATSAENYDYIKPEIKTEIVLDIKSGRHPIIEKLSPEPFVPNDIILNDSDQNLIILTGPNMAGKSTIMRQTALITIMAQMGSFVPAKSAKIGIVDKLFTRIGASDNLSGGDSTFMVEMKETAYILSNATKRSFILLDELGRGTSTYDGLSLAWGVAQFIFKRIKARTLFATHYHELMSLSKLFSGMRNFNVAVKQKGDDIFFLRKLIEGGVNRSYGIHVAKLANIPEEIISSARKKLIELESFAGKSEQLPLFFEENLTREPQKNDLMESEILAFDTTNSTPLEALIFIDKLKYKLKHK